MKILKDGTIEACCEWASSFLMNSEDGGPYRKLPLKSYVFTVQNDGDSYEVNLNFCPNCGKKTEVEE